MSAPETLPNWLKCIRMNFPNLMKTRSGMKQDISKKIKPGRIVVPDSLGVSESLQHWICLYDLVFQGHLDINQCIMIAKVIILIIAILIILIISMLIILIIAILIILIIATLIIIAIAILIILIILVIRIWIIWNWPERCPLPCQNLLRSRQSSQSPKTRNKIIQLGARIDINDNLFLCTLLLMVKNTLFQFLDFSNCLDGIANYYVSMSHSSHLESLPSLEFPVNEECIKA